jgi:coatomer protein complex subunit gamma
LPMTVDKLERSLQLYLSAPMSMQKADPITFETLPIVEDAPVGASGPAAEDDMDVEMSNEEAEVVKDAVDPAAVVYAIPELAYLGRAFRSSLPIPLTEAETEYVVQCTKHVFENHVVLQFSVQNTVDDQRLDNLTVLVDDSDSEVFNASGEIACEQVKYGETKNCFTILERNAEASLAPSHFNCELRFTVVQVDSASGEEMGDTFEEEYPLENLEIAAADFMAKVAVPDFRKAWDNIGSDHEILEKFALQFKTLEDAVVAIIDFLGMQPCDGTATVKAATAGKPHMLHLSGVFVKGHQVLSRAQISMQAGGGVVLKIAVRSDDADVSRMVADCIR